MASWTEARGRLAVCIEKKSDVKTLLDAPLKPARAATSSVPKGSILVEPCGVFRRTKACTGNGSR